MSSIKQRVRQLEDTLRRASRQTKIVVAFSSGGVSKIVGAGLDITCPESEAEKLISTLGPEFTVVCFKIPRPGIMPFEEVVM